MKKRSYNTIRTLLMTLVVAMGLSSCQEERKNCIVEIRTPYGKMKALLYDDTPKHRDNFLQLVDSHQYDSLLFHRVIRGYLIQGGDPHSRNAKPGEKLGHHQIGKPVPAEINYPVHYHKRGALCAARSQDDINPDRQSSGSQFYIVQGSRHTDKMLDEAEVVHDNAKRRRAYMDLLRFYQDSLQMLQDQGNAQALADMQIRIVEKAEEMVVAKGLFKFPEDVREAYRNVGGLPELDGEYTVFGEIIEGLNVIDSIASAAVELPGPRPSHDIRMAIRRAN